MPRTVARLTPSASRFRIGYAMLAVLAAIVLGTLGFHLIEGWPLADSLYLTVQTVTTVGYGDLTPVTQTGRAFAALFMLVGVAAVLYALTSTVQTIVQSELVATFGERRRQREMTKLQQHFIICGAGRVGSRIIREIRRTRLPFVVIERDREKVAHLIESGILVLVRDATLEETLHAAGVERAKGLAACLPDDADNVYVVLTARSLNADLHIVARAVEEEAQPKMIKAGANRVIAPTIIGSHRMAQALMRPAVADFMDSIVAENLDVGFEQMEVEASSSYAGQKLRATNIRSELDVVVIAIRRSDGQMIYHPSGETQLKAGDTLITIGRPEALSEMNKIARGLTKSELKG
ncbi:MAG TPA: potassium channel protein [Pyrinomonadaceae bacterium]|jgi:voltage-gated potassium channel